jgi:hypothetical protein
MAILDGDAECTTGLSAAIYSYWLSDPNNGFTSPLTTAQRKLLKVQCFQWARAIAAAHNADAPGGTGISFADGETPAGSIDGSNAVFTLAHTPAAGSLHLFLNGVRLRAGADFTLTGATITYAAGMVPQAGDRHDADYRY